MSRRCWERPFRRRGIMTGYKKVFNSEQQGDTAAELPA
jgi:hypothetical protein